MKDIAFCAVIENKANYLDEWLAYHYLIGVEHFYIMDDFSKDNVQEVLHKWVKKGLLTYTKLDEFLETSPSRQVISYLTYCDILKNNYKYLGFLDVGEFFVPPNGNIKDFLKTIPNEATVYARIVNPRYIAIDIKNSSHIFQPVENILISKEPIVSDEIRKFICKLKNEFPDIETNLSYLHGEELILNAKSLPYPPPETPQYIVSISSHGKYLQSTAPVAIASILHGNILPDRIILWVTEEGWEQNKYLQILQEKGLEIRYCEDFSTNDYIITADDNLFYQNNWLEQIMKHHKTQPDKIICHRALGIRVDSEYNLLPYDSWDLYIESQEPEKIFATGRAGILYPPRSLHKFIPQADDAWFWAMALLNENSYIVIKNGYSNIINIDNAQKGNIDSQLKTMVENNSQIKEIIKKIKPFNSVYIETLQNANFIFERPKMKYPKEKGLISVIVPIYNSETYLMECLDSLLAQTFQNWEGILVNDGSTDSCKKIIDEYAKRDNRFKAIHKENEGTLLARKTGLENSRGEYIANLDNDDTYEPYFLEKMISKITEINVDFVWCNVKNLPIVNGNNYNWSKNKIENVMSVLKSEGFRMNLWNKLIKRNIYEKVEFPQEHLVWDEDPVQTMQIAYYSNNVAFVSDTCYNWRKDSKTSASQTTNLVNEEKSKIHRILGVILKIKILEKFFGNSFPFDATIDEHLKRAIDFYNNFERETRIKYGIEGFVLNKIF